VKPTLGDHRQYLLSILPSCVCRVVATRGDTAVYSGVVTTREETAVGGPCGPLLSWKTATLVGCCWSPSGGLSWPPHKYPAKEDGRRSPCKEERPLLSSSPKLATLTGRQISE
jgi:hypothetical protein